MWCHFWLTYIRSVIIVLAFAFLLSLRCLLIVNISDCAFILFFGDLLRGVGMAWMYLGGLHFHLLQNHCDPTLKYKMKYTQLMGKISRLETEIMVLLNLYFLSTYINFYLVISFTSDSFPICQVRQESCYLAGRNPVSSKCEKRIHLKESLDLYMKKLQKKVA